MRDLPVEPTSPSRPPRWPLLVILGAACAFCWPVFAGRVMLPADLCLLMLPWQHLQSAFPAFHRAYNPMLDPIQQYLPWRIYAVDMIRRGVIPLWNPYSFCGTPFLANLQSALLYPPNLLFLLTGARHGFGVSAILHLTLGGWLMYWFLMRLGLRATAALFGALVFAFNGFTVTWLEYPTLSLWVLMWLPGVLLCYQQALSCPRSAWPGLAAGLVAFQLLGGHLQIAAYALLALLLYAAVATAAPGRPWRSRLLAASLALGPLATGMCLAAGQLLPTLELAAHSGRVAHTAGAALSTAFPLTHLVLYCVPNFFGNPVDYNYWGNYQHPAINFFETACYVGIPTLVLAAVGLRRWRLPYVSFFALLTALAVLAAVGSPVYLALYHLVPGFKELAGLGRILCLAAFGLAGLAAVGVDELQSRREARSAGPGVVVVGVAAVSLVVASWYVFEPAIGELGPSFASYLMAQVAAFVLLLVASLVLTELRARMRLGASVFAALALVLLVGDLFWFGLRFNPHTDSHLAYPETELLRWLRARAGHDRVTSLASDGMDWMPHNSPMIFRLRDIHGSDSLRVKWSFELVSPPDGSQAHYPPPDSPLLGELGVRYLLTRREPGEGWRLVRDDDTPVYERLSWKPRAWLTRSVRVVADEDMLDTLRHHAPLTWAGVSDPRVAAQLSPGEVAPSPDGTERVEFWRDGEDVVALLVRARAPSVLVLTDSYYPGWRAWVNGQQTPIYRVNYAFRGLRVPAGESHVVMRYEPASFQVGMFLSLAGLALVAGWLARFSGRGPRRRGRGRSSSARAPG